MDTSKLLFHGTGIYALAAIAESNTLSEGIHWQKPGEPRGPRTSQCFDIASGFITYNVHWGEGGVLVLDREALARDYDLVEYRDSCYTGELMSDEREIAIITSAVKNLDKYIVSIVCDPAIVPLALDEENVQAAIQECGWAFESEGEEGINEAKAAFAALLCHPKFNAWIPESGFPHHGNWEMRKKSPSP